MRTEDSLGRDRHERRQFAFDERFHPFLRRIGLLEIDFGPGVLISSVERHAVVSLGRVVVLDALLKQELDSLLKPTVSHCSYSTYSISKLTLEFSHQGAVHLQEKLSAKRERKRGKRKKSRQLLPDWRLAAEIGELFVGIVEDVALLLKSHGNRILVRIA